MKLKSILTINALSCAGTGLLLIVFPNFIASKFNVSPVASISGVGVFLLVFSIWVGALCYKTAISYKSLLAITIIDILWVIDSVLIISGNFFNLSEIGRVAIGAVAVWVALMAFMEGRYIPVLKKQIN